MSGVVSWTNNHDYPAFKLFVNISCLMYCWLHGMYPHGLRCENVHSISIMICIYYSAHTFKVCNKYIYLHMYVHIYRY